MYARTVVLDVIYTLYDHLGDPGDTTAM